MVGARKMIINVPERIEIRRTCTYLRTYTLHVDCLALVILIARST